MKGTYILFLESGKDLELEIGKLGKTAIPKGLYAYVGSAMGKSINLDSRISRHRKLAEKKKGSKQWHIDYFTTSPGVDITGIIKIFGRGIECDAAGAMERAGGKAVAQGFGSSDCKCETHFFRITEGVARAFLHELPNIF
jgi:endonuclease-3